jgi:DNA polymerase III epsilon subunit-like protein
MGDPLITDAEFGATTFVVIDFEATTPTGYRPEPIDVAAISLRMESGRRVESRRFSALMRPPDHAPITRFDTEQTGITSRMLAGKPSAGEVLAKLDAALPEPPFLLVAHNAATEAGILYDYADHCPRLATTDFLDTVRLARAAYPQLPSHRLDTLIQHLGIPRPIDRHRALPDVEITVQLFARLVVDSAHAGLWTTLAHLRRIGGYEPKAARPRQEVLFE